MSDRSHGGAVRPQRPADLTADRLSRTDRIRCLDTGEVVNADVVAAPVLADEEEVKLEPPAPRPVAPQALALDLSDDAETAPIFACDEALHQQVSTPDPEHQPLRQRRHRNRPPRPTCPDPRAHDPQQLNVPFSVGGITNRQP